MHAIAGTLYASKHANLAKEESISADNKAPSHDVLNTLRA